MSRQMRPDTSPARPARRTRKAPSAAAVAIATQEAPAALPDPRESGWYEYFSALQERQEYEGLMRASIADFAAIRNDIADLDDAAQKLASRIATVMGTGLHFESGYDAVKLLVTMEPLHAFRRDAVKLPEAMRANMRADLTEVTP